MVVYLWSFYKEVFLNTKYITQSFIAAAISILGSSLLTLYLLYTHFIGIKQKQITQIVEPQLAPQIITPTIFKETQPSIKDIEREINNLRKMHQDAISKLEERTKTLERTTLKMINDFSIKELRENEITKYNTQIINGSMETYPTFMKNFDKSEELTRIQGIRNEHVDLFKAVGVNFIYELSMQDPDELFNAIQDVKMGSSSLVLLPTKNMIIRWIRKACEHTRILNAAQLN